VELHQENNAYLSYWLSNTVTLLYLMQKNIKPASGGGYAARLKASGQQVGGWVGGQRAGTAGLIGKSRAMLLALDSPSMPCMI
jgi:myosin-5